MTIHVFFHLPSGVCRKVAAETGQTLLKLAQDNGFDLEGACEGCMACATCHVMVDPPWYAKLTPPGGDELAMLDLAVGRTWTSRLSCQIRMDDALDGLTVRVLK